jgi:hypothetical protein
MRTRTIEERAGSFVVLSEQGERLDAYLTEASAFRAAAKALTALGGGDIIKGDGTVIAIDPAPHLVAG